MTEKKKAYFPKKITPEEKAFADKVIIGHKKQDAAAMVWPDCKDPATKATSVLKKPAVQKEIDHELEKALITKNKVLKELDKCLMQPDDLKVKMDAIKTTIDLFGWKRNKIDLNINDGGDIEGRLGRLSEWALQAYLVEGLTDYLLGKIEEGVLQFATYVKLVESAAERNKIEFPSNIGGNIDTLSLEDKIKIMARRASFLRMFNVDLDKEYSMISTDYNVK